MLDRRLKVVDRDEEIFRSICEFMLDSGGQPPRIEDLVFMENAKPKSGILENQSVSKSTIFRSISRLEKMGLIAREKAGSARGIRVVESRFYIDIGNTVSEGVIRRFHEELIRERNTAK